MKIRDKNTESKANYARNGATNFVIVKEITHGKVLTQFW